MASQKENAILLYLNHKFNLSR